MLLIWIKKKKIITTLITTTTWITAPLAPDRLIGLVDKASASRAEIPGLNPACAEIFPGSSHTSDLKSALRWLPCQAPSAVGSVLGLVGPVSVYCDWVRWKVWSATSISVWQHVKLSEQIRPGDTLACCWNAKQPTNKNSSTYHHHQYHHNNLTHASLR